LDGGLTLRKASTDTQNNTNDADIHALSAIRTHDISVRVGEDSSCLRPRGNCERPLHTIPPLIWEVNGSLTEASYIDYEYLSVLLNSTRPIQEW
jgi:hypothetical protein